MKSNSPHQQQDEQNHDQQPQPRIKATFDKPGRYVWHCHIISHEDHEMMRVLHVGPGARGFVDFGAYGFAGRVTLENEATVHDNIGASGRVELKQRARVSSGTVMSTWIQSSLRKMRSWRAMLSPLTRLTLIETPRLPAPLTNTRPLLVH